MFHVSAQGVDERMINVHYQPINSPYGLCGRKATLKKKMKEELLSVGFRKVEGFNPYTTIPPYGTLPTFSTAWTWNISGQGLDSVARTQFIFRMFSDLSKLRIFFGISKRGLLFGPAETQSLVQELCESRGGRPGLSVLTSLLASVDVKIY